MHDLRVPLQSLEGRFLLGTKLLGCRVQCPARLPRCLQFRGLAGADVQQVEELFARVCQADQVLRPPPEIKQNTIHVKITRAALQLEAPVAELLYVFRARVVPIEQSEQSVRVVLVVVVGLK